MMMREGTSGSIRCQDCGNQAKKECVYMRCRTCCKSKGFQCQTHVKSTWVPLYRRRQKQQQQQLLQQQQHELLNLPPSTTTSSNYFGLLQQGHLSTSNYSTNPKRLKENPVSSSSGLEDHHHHDHHHDHDNQAKNFPAEVNAMATFHVVRVSSMVDDGGPHSHPHPHHRNHQHDVHHQHHQFAYQTSVSIGGHVFKGILYDQGPDQRQIGATYSSLGAGDQSPFAPGVVFQQPNLLNLSSSTRGSGATAGIINLSACSSSPSADQRPLFNVGSSSSSYPIFHPSSGFMSGMQFFPNRKS